MGRMGKSCEEGTGVYQEDEGTMRMFLTKYIDDTKGLKVIKNVTEEEYYVCDLDESMFQGAFRSLESAKDWMAK